jgi:hypothetical protein
MVACVFHPVAASSTLWFGRRIARWLLRRPGPSPVAAAARTPESLAALARCWRAPPRRWHAGARLARSRHGARQRAADAPLLPARDLPDRAALSRRPRKGARAVRGRVLSLRDGRLPPRSPARCSTRPRPRQLPSERCGGTCAHPPPHAVVRCSEAAARAGRQSRRNETCQEDAYRPRRRGCPGRGPPSRLPLRPARWDVDVRDGRRHATRMRQGRLRQEPTMVRCQTFRGQVTPSQPDADGRDSSPKRRLHSDTSTAPAREGAFVSGPVRRRLAGTLPRTWGPARGHVPLYHVSPSHRRALAM